MKKELQAFNFRRVLPLAVIFGAVLITIVVAKMQILESKRPPSSQQLRWHAFESKKQNKNSVSVPNGRLFMQNPI